MCSLSEDLKLEVAQVRQPQKYNWTKHGKISCQELFQGVPLWLSGLRSSVVTAVVQIPSLAQEWMRNEWNPVGATLAWGTAKKKKKKTVPQGFCDTNESK